MILNRRSLLFGLIAAPAVIAADRLMKLPKREIIKPSRSVIIQHGFNDLYVDGIHPTPEAYVRQLAQYVDARRAAGWTAIYTGPQLRA